MVPNTHRKKKLLEKTLKEKKIVQKPEKCRFCWKNIPKNGTYCCWWSENNYNDTNDRFLRSSPPGLV